MAVVEGYKDVCLRADVCVLVHRTKLPLGVAVDPAVCSFVPSDGTQ